MKGCSATKTYASELRRAGNLSEVLLWEQLKDKKLGGLRFLRQQTIGGYIADFYCPERKVVIEVDGASHNYKTEYDEHRDKYMKSLGIKTIRIGDTDVKQNLNGVVSWLCSEILP